MSHGFVRGANFRGTVVGTIRFIYDDFFRNIMILQINAFLGCGIMLYSKEEHGQDHTFDQPPIDSWSERLDRVAFWRWCIISIITLPLIGPP